MGTRRTERESEKRGRSALEQMRAAGEEIRKLPDPLRRELEKARDAYEEHRRESAAALDLTTRFD